MRSCAKCGSPLLEAHAFCTRCGTPVATAVASSGPTAILEHPEPRDPVHSSSDPAPLTAPLATPGPEAPTRGLAEQSQPPHLSRITPISRRGTYIAIGTVLVVLAAAGAVALTHSGGGSPCVDAIKGSDSASAKVLQYEGPIVKSCPTLASFQAAFNMNLQDHTASPWAVLIFCQSGLHASTPAADYTSTLCNDVRATPSDAHGNFEVGSVTTMEIAPPTTFPSLTATANPVPLSTTPSTPPTTIIIPPQPTLSFVVTLEIIAPKPARITEVSVIENGSTVVELGKSIPITKSITFHQGVSLDFAAGGFDPETEPGAVTCRISVNGKVLDEKVGSPQTGSVGCMAVAP